MIKIAFFGGTGFLGSAFLEYIKSNNIKNLNLIQISRHLKKNFNNSIQIDATKKNDFLKLPDFDVVIHGVADSSLGPELEAYTKIHKQLLSTFNIAEFCKKKKVKKLIFLSSGAVYGKARIKKENFKNTQIDLSSPQSSYAFSKITSEEYLKSFCKTNNINLKILRCFSFGGRSMPIKSHYALSNFINSIKSNQDIRINGDGLDIRSYMHQDDFAYILSKTVSEDNIPDILNVGSDKAISILDLAKKILLRSESNVKINLLNYSKSINRIYLPNTNLLKKTFPNFKLKSINKIIDDLLV